MKIDKVNESYAHHILLICRITLGFVFIYHGVFPKIIFLSAIEVSLIDASGFGIPATILSPIAGIGEVVIGLLIIFWRSSLLSIYIAVGILIFLLSYVAYVDQPLIVEAFNPVTTNIPVIVLCYITIYIEKNILHNNS